MTITGSFGEQSALWVLLAVSTANVVLGVWRPRLTRIRGHRIKNHEASLIQFRPLDVSGVKTQSDILTAWSLR